MGTFLCGPRDGKTFCVPFHHSYLKLWNKFHNKREIHIIQINVKNGYFPILGFIVIKWSRLFFEL